MNTSKRFGSACVASPHYLASAAGLATLSAGGNAVDAAIAINLTLGVVTPYLCGYGGDLFAMVWDGDALHAYDGSGASGAQATLERARAAAGGDALPRRGPLTITVPGAVDGWFALLERFGTRSFEELAAHALRYAREGFPLTDAGARSIAGSALAYPDEEEWQAVYGGTRAGVRLVQPGIARTIETLAKHGRDAYYRGEIAEAIASHLAQRGGFVGAHDLASHAGRWVDPLSHPYAGARIVEMPPPTQGIAALEALGIAGGLPAAEPESADLHHGLIEATKLALADLDARVTDPAFMAEPAEVVLSPGSLDARRARIDPARAGEVPTWPALGGGTAYMCAADADGMLVSLIQSNYAGFGSGVTVPGWGINLHNRGAWFRLDPSHANVIAPGKRTMHTLIPAMAFRGERPTLVFGTMGGEGQAQTHVQLAARIVGEGVGPQEAIDRPRWFASPTDWSVIVEDRFEPEVLESLRARGHDVRVTGPFDSRMGHAHAILIEEGGYACASDPRSEGAALGF